jgi:hypothetical protein
MAAVVGFNEGVPHIFGANLGIADRDVKEEFSSPMILNQVCSSGVWVLLCCFGGRAFFFYSLSNDSVLDDIPIDM